ncbi:MAG: anti-sigma factor antagonist [Clostridiales bacterium]|jgi:stage II sporulation protein AA (anti-sigma F factor antagonist)|nr:anti-sigma factor antagonist [Clostridiales bacterium]
MVINGEFKNGKLTVFLKGDLDHHAAREAMRELTLKIDTHLPRSCVLDLKNLRFMDSSGIALILKTDKRMKELEGKFCVVNVPPQPKRVLNASGISRIIDIREAGI